MAKVRLALACVVALSAAAQAQSSVFAGFVLGDSAHRPLEGADVAFTDINLRTRTNAKGVFRLFNIPAGIHHLAVRKLGFVALSVSISIPAGDTIIRRIVLSSTQILDTIEVAAQRAIVPEFEERRSKGFGSFITHTAFEKDPGKRVSDVLASLPGLRVHTDQNGRSYAMSSRGRVTIMNANANCYAHVYVDGAAIYTGRDGEPLFDLNTMPRADMEGVEFYASGAQAPPQYNRDGATCGVLLLWTRR